MKNSLLETQYDCPKLFHAILIIDCTNKIDAPSVSRYIQMSKGKIGIFILIPF